MIKNTIKLLQCTKNSLSISSANIYQSAVVKEKWDLLTAVLIERKPVITPGMHDLEKDFKDYMSALEFERSLRSDTEVSLEKEKKLFAQKKELDEVDITTQQSTQDFIDACKEELSKFQAAERITNADKSNDVKSLQRKLDKHLVLVLKQKIGDANFHLLPQGERKVDETLRQCADRVLREKCGNGIKAQIFGNAPCGVYKYKYPKDVRNDKNVIGAKVFIYFARYSSGQVEEENVDFKWLDKSELDKILPRPYKKSVLPILFD